MSQRDANQRGSEGSRVLRNVASIGAFAMSPVQMFLLVRALGPNGYGRWWWTYVIVEAATLLGMLGAELYVRREVPRIDREGGGDDEVMAVVGSSLVVAGVVGLVIGALLIAIAHPVAAAQGDPELGVFLAVLGLQPLFLNLTAVLGAALQSRDVLAPVAMLRGVVIPVIQAAMLLLAWRGGLATRPTLVLVLGATLLGLVGMVVLYGRHLSIVRTLRHVVRPRHARDALRYGARLFVPALLFTVGNKLDLYVLGSYAGAAVVAVYAGCFQLAAGVANVRFVFDPIIQTQIAALYGDHRSELAASLRRLARLTAFAMAPVVVLLVVVGEPILAFLLGHPAPEAVIPLVILCGGNIVGGITVAAWLVPMMMPGRALALLAGIALIAKILLLAALVPAYGPIGAAIAAVAAYFVAVYGQVWLGSRGLGHRPYSADVIPMLLVTGVVAAAGRWLYIALLDRIEMMLATCFAAGASLAVLVVVQWYLLTQTERASFLAIFGLGPRDATG